MHRTNYNLARSFYEHALAHPDRTALHVEGAAVAYHELAAFASRAAAAMGAGQKVGILASRTLGAYAGVLGAAWSGAAYVPLSPKAPEERLARIFDIVGLDALVVDAKGAARLTPELRRIAPRTILDLSNGIAGLPASGPAEPVHRDADGLAYILFTSGTTGIPKGVQIALGSVAQFLQAMRQRVELTPSDRAAQMSELTFDVSVFEMFSAWDSGASVHVVPPNQLMAPARFIVDQKLTVWSSVPSVAAIMRRMKMLKPGAFPSIRYSAFAGEALPYALAEAWAEAAPASVIENLYGPTEATVYCLGATVGPDYPATPERGTVPSGYPLAGLEAAILDETLAFLPSGRAGQLAIAGGQLATGYYGEPGLTRARFIEIDGKTWYLTGDLARRDERGIIHHLGRIDHQVKILGQRVEMEEVEAHLRAVCGTDNVAAVGWPVEDGMVAGIVAFTSGATGSPGQIREAMLRRLPAYMVPGRIVELDALPLGSSGKIDRRALADSLAGTPAVAGVLA